MIATRKLPRNTTLSEEDFLYTWDCFQGVRDLYTRAAKEGRFVLFTAAQ